MDFELGYMGLFAATFLAATVIPFSSEIIVTAMLLKNYDPVSVIFFATLGNWSGGMTSYFLGYLGKWEWLEKWFRIKKTKIEKFKYRVDRYGAYIAFFSWLPGIGDVLAIALGLFRVNAYQVAIFMLIGKGLRFVGWTVVLLYGKTWF